ncbi:GerMN domain-containing protein [Anaeromicropila herbilytica]|uniref:GerMN domain-containing protein n=1 Tax=Anaeromicropila herbilytica TaxID=2785025 RepID=A0A7R7EME0_9FIRM|nr:GerMN domain-containing protein [Anaeromicropila herbilytica]BCN31424.1 hypothetical protein bsdtb5_27190 [Anaeromicropila herbilytica]
MKARILKKYLILIIVFTASVTMLVGCGSKKEKTNKDITVTETVKPSKGDDANSGTDSSNSTATSKEETNTPAKEDTKELPIYVMNNDTLEKEDYVDMVPQDSKITAEFIVNEVVKNFEQNGVTIGINSVTTKGDTIYVDFKSDKAPLANVGSGVEATILDCIAQSLVDNLDGHNKVIYRVDGKAYESGHIILDLNEVYLND